MGYVDAQINETKEKINKVNETIYKEIDKLRKELLGELRNELESYALFFHARIECLKTFLGVNKKVTSIFPKIYLSYIRRLVRKWLIVLLCYGKMWYKEHPLQYAVQSL